MCGVFATVLQQGSATKEVYKGLKRVEYRGYDSWGVVYKGTEKLVVKKDAGGLPEFGEFDWEKTGKMAMGHTRWATHGGATKVNAHPHLDESGQLAVVHNGIIENYGDLKKELIRKGHEFKSETDTEVAVHLIEEKLQSDTLADSVRNVFGELNGLNALVVMSFEDDKLIGVKNGSPLVVGSGVEGSYIASDPSALYGLVSEVYYLEDREMVMVDANGYTVFRVDSGEEVAVQVSTLKGKIEDEGLGEYEDYMTKEMHEQPGVIRNLSTDVEQVKAAARLIRNAYGTYMIGCGSAGYAGLCGTYLFSKVAKRHVNFAVGSEFKYLTDFLTDKSLLIALSQSGETIDVIDSVKEAKKKGAGLVALTNVKGSTVARMSDEQLWLNAGIERCVLATKSFTAKLSLLIMLANELNGNLERGQQLLGTASRIVEKLLQKTEMSKIENLARELVNRKHIYILGRGMSYPVALEAALKIKEVSYIHAEGFAAGELKHGVIALVDTGTPVVVFAPQDETYESTISNAIEVKARGGRVIGISHQPHEVFDDYFEIENCDEATIIPNTVWSQLLGYYLAKEKGLNPDRPRNLAKSVTVR